MKDLAAYIDHTLLAANATQNGIENLRAEAKQNRFYAVCINSCNVKIAKKYLYNSAVLIATSIGFPLGAACTESKIAEAKTAIIDGAYEINMVMNLGFFKDQKYQFVQAEIESVKKAIGSKVLKVIIETCYLIDKEISIASEIVMRA